MNRIDKNIVSQHLNRLADMLEVAYPNLIDIKLYPVENKDLEFTCDVCHKISSRNPAEIFVNTIQLVETMENDTVDFDMFVWTVKDFYHEYRHFQQAYYFYQDENPTDDILFMAQLRYVSLALPEFKRYAGFRLPNEVDAELYGWLKTVEYFDNQGVDVRDILYKDVVRRREYKYGWYGDLNTWNYDSAVQSLKDNLNYLRNYKVDFVNQPWVNMKDWKGETALFRKFKSKCFADAYNRAESVSEALHILFTFATKQDKASMRHFSCLKDSIQEGKRDYRCKRADRLDGLKNHNIFKYIEQEEGHEQMSSEQQSDDFSF